MKLNPYLNFDGNCEQAFTFYKQVFGREFSYLGRFGDMPEEHQQGIPQEQLNRIMHVSLDIGGNILMGGDVLPGYGAPFVMGNNFSISINTESKQDADALFLKLSEDGAVIMPMESTFWGDYFGMVTDAFGVNWMISFNEQSKP